MKPRTFAVAMGAFAAIAVTGYVASQYLHGQACADFARFEQLGEGGEPCGVAVAALAASVSDNEAASHRAMWLAWMGISGMVLTAGVKAFRIRFPR